MAFEIFKRTAPPATIAHGQSGNVADGPRVISQSGGGIDGRQLVQRRHVDFLEHQIRWRWLLDSYEGGDRYRNAVYGPDRKGLPTRNLFRHRREYPDPQQFPVDLGQGAGGLGNVLAPPITGIGPFPGMLGSDAAATAQDDDYELRRSRTPVPEFVAEAVEIHLSKVYDQEITRDGPPDLIEWWTDVDGAGTPIDDWMRETVAPLLVVLGNLDLVFDHPALPEGEQPAKSMADEKALGLDKCIASYILPENMVWWRTDAAGRYTECLVREYTDPSDRKDVDEKGRVIDPEAKGQAGADWRKLYVRYRHWTDKGWTVYSDDGEEASDFVPHSFGRVPIVRLIDQKKHRCRTVGKSRYEAIAELQREYYNRDSELILSDTLQAHPLLSGPEDYCKADNTLSIGPGYVLPKKKNPESGAYEGWEYTSPPKDPADSLRHNKQDLVDMKDRRACLTKPAGAATGSGAGGGSSTTAQSGIAKTLDSQTGHKILKSIAQSLAKSERFIAEYALLVLRGAPPKPADKEAISVVYPSKFDLQSAGELTQGLAQLHTTANSAGDLPTTDKAGIKAIIRQLLQGEDDDEYATMDDEVDQHVDKKAKQKQQAAEGGITSNADAFDGAGTDEAEGGQDPTGQSAATSVTNAALVVT